MVTREPAQDGDLPPASNLWEDMGSAQQQQQQQQSYSTATANTTQGHEENVWNVTTPTPPIRQPQPLRPAYTGTNPFLRQQHSLPSLQTPLRPVDATIPPLPDPNAFAQLSLQEQSNNPWQPALNHGQTPTSPHPQSSQPQSYRPTLGSLVSSLAPHDAQGAWSSESVQKSTTPPQVRSPVLISLSSDNDPSWDEVHKPLPTASAQPSADLSQIPDDGHAWDDAGQAGKGKGRAMSRTPSSPSLAQDTRPDGWNPMESTSTSSSQAATLSPPTLQLGDSHAGTSSSFSRVGEEELKETYQIKKIEWVDSNTPKTQRTSPILVQNANGPCPLLALVNALVMTATQESESSLVQVLKPREQVTLRLLLDAVFEELMSRNTDPDAPLPDVSLLYSFLKELHTGMNVNPQYLPTEDIRRLLKRTSLTHVHPSERDDFIPGTFETTTELELYSTFSIPLVHGWIPKQGEPAYEAFERQTASYEDVQHLLFREEELEHKLTRDVMEMTEEEQQLYQDILTIKSFLDTSATQLTSWGLEVITKVIEPGSFAILFRNDHFSTLYKHPRTQQLLQLVTDAGYVSHKDVVWESLVDVNGERAEFFSGEFQVVSGAQGHGEQPSELATARAPPGANNQALGDAPGPSRAATPNRWQAPRDGDISAREQEDRDLALAIQLQEEEDARQHEEQARRRRESHLSEQYIEEQGRQPPTTPPNRHSSNNLSNRHARGPSPPARRSNNSVTSPQPIRPLVTAATAQPSRPSVPLTYRQPDETIDAPPSYDEAAKTRPYQPPVGHPSHPESSATPTTPGAPATARTRSDARTSRASVASNASTRSATANGTRPLGSTNTSPAAHRGAQAQAQAQARPRPPRLQGAANAGYPGAAARLPPPRQFVEFSPSTERAAERDRDEKCVVM